jgi:hypothetical protein
VAKANTATTEYRAAKRKVGEDEKTLTPDAPEIVTFPLPVRTTEQEKSEGSPDGTINVMPLALFIATTLPLSPEATV